MFEFLARAYAEARNAEPNQCLDWIKLYRERFWKKYLKKHPLPFEPD
jgi:hypothetical protein